MRLADHPLSRPLEVWLPRRVKQGLLPVMVLLALLLLLTLETSSSDTSPFLYVGF